MMTKEDKANDARDRLIEITARLTLLIARRVGVVSLDETDKDIERAIARMAAARKQD